VIILQTERLLLRTMTLDDDSFILNLLNSPSWIKYIGDRSVHTIDAAREYLTGKVLPNYENFGFGFYLIERRKDHVAIGNCGLTLREGMDHVDIGYSLLDSYVGQGYAFEAAQAIVSHGFNVHKLDHIAAITTADNHRSIHLLNKLGLDYHKMINLPGDNEELMLFGINASTEGSTQ